MGNLPPSSAGTRRPKPDKSALIEAANAFFVEDSKFADVDLVSRVIMSDTWVGVKFIDGSTMDIAEFRKPYDPIPGHRFKSLAEIDEAINGGWL